MRRRMIALLPMLLLLAATACGGGGQNSAPALSATPEKRPELDLETLRKAINGSWIAGVPAADGKDRPENWGFGYNEQKEIEVVEQKVDGDRATVVVNMKTRSNPRERRQLSLEGQLRFHLELETEFIFREWEVTDVENISFKYTRLAPPSLPPGVPPLPGDAPPPPPSPGASPQPSPSAKPSPSPSPPRN